MNFILRKKFLTADNCVRCHGSLIALGGKIANVSYIVAKLTTFCLGKLTLRYNSNLIVSSFYFYLTSCTIQVLKICLEIYQYGSVGTVCLQHIIMFTLEREHQLISGQKSYYFI